MKFKIATNFVSIYSSWIAGICLIAMLIITCLEVVGRYLGHPIQGSFEVVGQLLVPVTWFAIADTQSHRGHIDIDVLFKLFPKRAQTIIEVINYSLCTGLFLLATWQCIVLGISFWKAHLITETIGLVLAPFVFTVALGCFIMCVLLVVQLSDTLNFLIRR